MSNPTETDFQNGLDPLVEDQIEGALNEVRRIVERRPSDAGWEHQMSIARAAIATFDTTGFMQLPNRTRDRIFAITALQRLAYAEVDGPRATDIAEWCMNQWLSLLQTDAEDLDALRGQ